MQRKTSNVFPLDFESPEIADTSCMLGLNSIAKLYVVEVLDKSILWKRKLTGSYN